MKRIKEVVPGLFMAAFSISFGMWLLNNGNLDFRSCAKGSCASGGAIALSAILVGLIYLGVSINRLIPEKWKQELIQKLKNRNQVRNAPKYKYGKIPPRDEAAIDEAIRKSRNEKVNNRRERQ